MSTNDTRSYKSNEPPSKEEMVYCGEHDLNTASKHVEDNIDGTLTVKDSQRAAAGAKPGDYIWIRVERDGDETWARRKLHSTGRSVTLPLSDRKKIGLEPGDKIRYWIDFAGTASEQKTTANYNMSQESNSKGTDRDPYVVDKSESSFIYHVISDSDEDETVCGIDLAGRDANRFSDPGDVLEICTDCNVRSSGDMSNREIVEWLAHTIDGFASPSDQNPSYLSKGQLAALRDHLLDQEEG